MRAPLRTEYNNMSVTSYEFLIITEFPKKEIRAEPSRAEGGSAAGGERGASSAVESVCVRRIGRKIEYLPRLPRYLGQIIACKGIRLKFSTAEMRKYCKLSDLRDALSSLLEL